MTGRPSGRCAATEALERIANVGDHGLRIGAERDALRYAEKEARDALASPCCVSAADQEQVKEALEKAATLPTWNRPMVEAKHAAQAALALLGSNEEEER